MHVFADDSKHFMIDIETTGLVPWVHNITSCAIVEFDTRTEAKDWGTWRLSYLPPEPVCDADTMAWRKKHGVDVLEEKLSTFTPKAFLESVSSFLAPTPKEKRYLWAKHINFDMVFLQAMYEKYNIPLPWKYHNLIDLPSFITGCGFSPIEFQNSVPFDGAKHFALDDCVYQAKLARIAWKYKG